MPFIAKKDLKTLLGGVTLAAAAGLLMGGAMQPDLREGAGPEGPQILGPVSGERFWEPRYAPGVTYTAAGEDVPDYVIGTDWLKPPEHLDDAYAEADFDIPFEDESVAFDDYEPAPIRVVRVWDEPPREAPAFPSASGGVPYGADLPAPPPPPVAAAAGAYIAVLGG